MALTDFIPSFSRRQPPPVEPETPAADSQAPAPLPDRAMTRIDAIMTIRQYREHFNSNPQATIVGEFTRPQVYNDEGEFFDRPLGDGLRLRAKMGPGPHDPFISANVGPYSQKIESSAILCPSENGMATYALQASNPSDTAVLTALETKFEREGESMRAELDDWVVAQRADSPPGTYMIGDLYEVAAQAGYNEDETDLMLYQSEFTVPDQLAQGLVDLGYTNFRGKQTATLAPPEVGADVNEGLDIEPGTSRSPEVSKLVSGIAARLAIDNDDRPTRTPVIESDQLSRDDEGADYQR